VRLRQNRRDWRRVTSTAVRAASTPVDGNTAVGCRASDAPGSAAAVAVEAGKTGEWTLAAVVSLGMQFDNAMQAVVAGCSAAGASVRVRAAGASVCMRAAVVVLNDTRWKNDGGDVLSAKYG
jgi:hypothetical protein